MYLGVLVANLTTFVGGICAVFDHVGDYTYGLLFRYRKDRFTHRVNFRRLAVDL